jgi:hypothetical protein
MTKHLPDRGDLHRGVDRAAALRKTFEAIRVGAARGASRRANAPIRHREWWKGGGGVAPVLGAPRQSTQALKIW